MCRQDATVEEQRRNIIRMGNDLEGDQYCRDQDDDEEVEVEAEEAIEVVYDPPELSSASSLSSSSSTSKTTAWFHGAGGASTFVATAIHDYYSSNHFFGGTSSGESSNDNDDPCATCHDNDNDNPDDRKGEQEQSSSASEPEISPLSSLSSSSSWDDEISSLFATATSSAAAGSNNSPSTTLTDKAKELFQSGFSKLATVVEGATEGITSRTVDQYIDHVITDLSKQTMELLRCSGITTVNGIRLTKSIIPNAMLLYDAILEDVDVDDDESTSRDGYDDDEEEESSCSIIEEQEEKFVQVVVPNMQAAASFATLETNKDEGRESDGEEFWGSGYHVLNDKRDTGDRQSNSAPGSHDDIIRNDYASDGGTSYSPETSQEYTSSQQCIPVKTNNNKDPYPDISLEDIPIFSKSCHNNIHHYQRSYEGGQHDIDPDIFMMFEEITLNDGSDVEENGGDDKDDDDDDDNDDNNDDNDDNDKEKNDQQEDDEEEDDEEEDVGDDHEADTIKMQDDIDIRHEKFEPRDTRVAITEETKEVITTPVISSNNAYYRYGNIKIRYA